MIRHALLTALLSISTTLGAAAADAPTTATAIFAGGCFWCAEADFDKRDGVISTTSGFDGGTTPDPTYEQVSSGGTAYVESVKVVYDPQKVTYPQLLDYFWRHIDPLDGSGQFCDHGPQYRSVIFYETEEQRQQALASKQALERSGRFGKPIATTIAPSTQFYPAEDYHQDFYKKNPLRYNTYRAGCGRDQRVRALWGETAGDKPS